MTALPLSVLADLSDGVATLDGEFRATACNDTAARRLGTTEAQLVGTPVWEVLPGVSERSLRERASTAGDEGVVLGRLDLGGRGRPTVGLYPVDGGYAVLLIRTATPDVDGESTPAVRGSLEDDPGEDWLGETLLNIDGVLSETATRIEAERAVCATLGASGLYRLVWVAAYTPGWEQLEPRARAGPAAEFMGLHDLALDEGGRLTQLLQTVLDTGETAVMGAIETDPTASEWRDEAAAHGLEAVALVPVVTRSAVSGVVACYTDRAEAFGSRERRQLASVGARLGQTVRTLELERLVHGETVVELTFDSADEGSFLVEASRDLDCGIEVLSSLPSDGASMLYYLAVEGCLPEACARHCREADGIEAVRVVDGSDEPGGVLELVTDRRTLASTLVANDAAVTAHRVAAGRAEVVCEVATERDLGELLGPLTERFPATELRSKRQRDRGAERASRAARGVDRIFETELTDRQRQCLRAAVYGGYFTSPRKSTGEEIAAALSMTQPTFSYHLRKAQQRLLATLLRTDASGGPMAAGFHP